MLIHGEVDERFARQLRAADARGVVELCGAFGPAELPELLAGVDVAVMPSLWWDCAPLMAAECLAGRVPLVAPRLGGLGEAVRHEVDGLLFDGLDAGDLARQLDRLAGEPGLLERLQAGIEAPRPFAEYVDELEAYYGGERPSRAPLATAAPGHHLAGRPRPAHEPLAHQQRGHRAPGARPAPRPRGRAPRHAAAPHRRRRGPPPVAARPAPAALGPPGRHPAVGVRRHPDRVGGPAAPRTSTRSGSPAATCATCTCAPASTRTASTSSPTGSTSSASRPTGPAYALDAPAALRFLFVGGAIGRKGVDVLLAAWQQAFAGRDDVQLVIKDFGSDGVYRGADRSAVARAWPTAGALVHLDADLSDEEMAALYRACDVLVHPYRGEGFAMPVLEAMASGLPVIHTAGGPTDEFCPPQAGWRIRSQPPGAARRPRGPLRDRRRAVDARARRRRTSPSSCARPPTPAPRSASAAAPWAARPPCTSAGTASPRSTPSAPPRWPPAPPRPLAAERELDGAPAVLATPAWRGEDDLPALLRAWTHAPAGACLYLLADPATDGEPAELEARVMAAAAGIDLDACPDIAILREHAVPGRDAALHAAAELYVPLHDACAGHLRLAGAKAATPAELGIRLAARPATHAA